MKNGAGVVDKATVMISDYPNHTAVCAKWAACLMDAETRRTGGNHMDRVVRILNASDARQAPNLAQLAKQKTTIVRKFEAEETEQLLADIEGGAVVGAHSSNEMGANTEDSLCQMRDCPTVWIFFICSSRFFVLCSWPDMQITRLYPKQLSAGAACRSASRQTSR